METLRKRGIRVEISQNSTVMSIPNELLGFNTAAYEISTAYQAQAREIGEVLNGVIAKDNRTHFLDTVFVEGHTAYSDDRDRRFRHRDRAVRSS